jgi:hypothetical protein
MVGIVKGKKASIQLKDNGTELFAFQKFNDGVHSP